MPTYSSQRVIELDYLRGLAAFAVLFFHFAFKGPSEKWMLNSDFGLVGHWAGYGYLGVNLFFMISGFVIAMSAQSGDWRVFLSSRLSRLIPAMWICASITAIVLATHGFEAKATLGNYLASLTLVPNWFGYSGLDAAYWSLRIEVQFYIAVGLLLAFGRLQWAPALIVIWLLASSINLVRPIWRVDYLLCLTWAPYFVFGIILYDWRNNGTSKRQSFALIWSTLLGLGYAYKSAIKDGYENPWITCGLVLCIGGLFAYCCLKKKTPPTSGLTDQTTTSVSSKHRIAAILGAISYPLYLVHQEVGYLTYNFLGQTFELNSNTGNWLRLVVTVGLITVVALLIHLGPEKWAAREFRKVLVAILKPR